MKRLLIIAVLAIGMTATAQNNPKVDVVIDTKKDTAQVDKKSYKLGITKAERATKAELAKMGKYQILNPLALFSDEKLNAYRLD